MAEVFEGGGSLTAELNKINGKIYIRGHCDMGEALYASYMADKGLKGNMGEDKAGDVVEGMLSLQWFQERGGGKLDRLGDMAIFHKMLQEELNQTTLRLGSDNGAEKKGKSGRWRGNLRRGWAAGAATKPGARAASRPTLTRPCRPPPPPALQP